jgi:hypothetical protein
VQHRSAALDYYLAAVPRLYLLINGSRKIVYGSRRIICGRNPLQLNGDDDEPLATTL